jgi:putative NADH-flavin reductase
MTQLAVFGANGPTGRQVVQQALASDHRVIAVTRKPNDFPFSSPRLDVVVADVTDRDGVDQALAGADAVISTYGVPYGRAKITVYSQGITNTT